MGRQIWSISIEPGQTRIGAAGCERILQVTVVAGVQSKAVKTTDFKRVTVDTTVQEKAVSYPTDSKLLNRSRVRLVRLCRKQGVTLRQSYARKGPRALQQANRYSHAKQYRRLRREVKRLRTSPCSTPYRACPCGCKQGGRLWAGWCVTVSVTPRAIRPDRRCLRTSWP